MARLQDINIQTERATKPFPVEGFGLPLILGQNEPFYFAVIGEEDSGYKLTVTNSGEVFIEVEHVDPGTSGSALTINKTGSGTNVDPYVITATLATDGNGDIISTASEVVSAINNEAGVGSGTAIVSAEVLTDGSGVVPLVSGIALDAEVFRIVSEARTLTDQYSTEDAEYKMVSAMTQQTPSPAEIAVYSKQYSSSTIQDVLNDIVNTINDDWFYLLVTSRDKDVIQKAGEWAATNGKIFVGCTDDITVLDNRNYDEEHYLLHTSPTDYPDAALVGRVAPKVPGSFTYKWQTLAGQKASTFSMTDLKEIREKNGQTLSKVGNYVYTNEGQVTSGEFTDVILAQYVTDARLYEALIRLFINQDSVPFDGTGINQLESTVANVLKRLGRQGIIAKATTDEQLENSYDKKYQFTVTTLTSDQVSSTDRANREYNGLEWTYRLAGAIHKTTIRGRITV